MTQAEHILEFLFHLQWPGKLPRGVQVLNPYQDPVIQHICTVFYTKYYNDTNPRTLICGINPGRFGGGLTGIPFTDPTQLPLVTGLTLPVEGTVRQELSATFIHQMIQSFGGYEAFFSRFHFTSVSPLGFTKEGINLNYYDLPALQKSTEGFALTCFRKQISTGISTARIYCLGEGANYKYLKALNERHQLFGEVVPLAHPRYIMQYKRKFLADYLADYLAKLGQA